MDQATIALLVSALGPGLVKVLEKILEKGIIEPAVELGMKPLRDWAQRGYDESRDGKLLRSAVMDSLAELVNTLPTEKRLPFKLKLSGLTDNSRTMLAAAAVEMAQNTPEKIPDHLLISLGLHQRQRELLANFLFLLRKRLSITEKYSSLIAYANQLDQRGILNGLTHQIDQISDQMDRLITIEEQIIAERHLTVNDQEALQDYLNLLRERLRYVPLPLARFSPNARSDADIKQIYVPIGVHDLRGETEAFFRTGSLRGKPSPTNKDNEKVDIRLMDFGEVLSRYERFILVGPPGCGKTTLLRRAALSIAEGHALEDLGWESPPLFPIFVRLRNFEAFLSQPPRPFVNPASGALTAYLDHYYREENRLKLTPDFFDNRLHEGNCQIFLDGLDEVSADRSGVSQQVNYFIRHYGQFGNRFGLTSRQRGFETVELHLRPSSLALLEINRLGYQGVRKLVENLVGHLETDPYQRAKDYKKLMQIISNSRDLTELAGTPLFCTALVLVFKYHGADLPKRRVDIFQEIVDLLLGFLKAQDQEIAQANILGLEDGTDATFRDLKSAVYTKKRRLSHLALDMQEKHKTEISNAEAIKLISEYLQERERKDPNSAETGAENFLQNMQERSGLLVEVEPQVFSFTHEGFREYLAANALINKRENEFIQTILEHIQDDRWEQVLLLAGAHSELPDAWRKYLVTEVMKVGNQFKQEGQMEAWVRHLLMAGRLARDMADYLPGIEKHEVENSLYTAMQDVELVPHIRAAAGDLWDDLAQLPNEVYEFAHVVPQSDADNVKTSVSGSQKGYWIAKFPITNWQYLRFVEADDFHDPVFWHGFPRFNEKSQSMKNSWGDLGWRWFQEFLNNMTESLEYKRLYPRYWDQQPSDIVRPSVPVVGVTWYEANAYCKWLQHHWSDLKEGRLNPEIKPIQLRLPTEMEWLYAAGGDRPADRFPWDEPDRVKGTEREIIERANLEESGIKRSTSVLMYPLGRSIPYGLWDVAGNVWEWLANYYNAEHVSVALRGGSYNNRIDEARCTARDGFNPVYWYRYFGFRVLALSSWQ
jgi:formylglycine-generating enzyme required for sulfatase activity